MGSAYDADSDGEEKYYVYNYNEIKDIKNIEKYFEINQEEIGKKIILVEKEKQKKKLLKNFAN